MDARVALRVAFYLVLVLGVSVLLNPLYGVAAALLLRIADALIVGAWQGYQQARAEKRKFHVPHYLLAPDGEVLEVVSEDHQERRRGR